MALRPNPNRKFEELKAAAAHGRLPYERDAWLNMAFYLDEQYVEWDDTTRNIRRIPRHEKAKHTPRPVVNKIMHFTQQEHASALQDRPTVDVMPPTDDLTDQSDTAVAKAYAEWVAEPINADFDAKLSSATLWSLIAGDGYLKWVWNPREGRPDIIAPNWFELYPDPYAKKFRDCRYMIHSQFMDVEQVFELWGVEVKPAKVEKADLMRTELLRGMGSAPVLAGVTVNELWMKPCRRYPEGLYVVWSGTDTLVPAGPLPYKHKRLPFTQIGCIERPDSLHFMSPIKYLRSAQMELNKYHAQRIMIRERFANPKWAIPAELEMETLPDDTPSQILRYSGAQMGLKPEIIQGTHMPDNGDGAVLEEQMMHIVGIHEVSQGQVPGRVEAAKAIELLKQADADRLQTMRKTIHASISEGYYQILELARQYAPEEQIIHAYSREGVPEVKHFKAGDLKPGFRIRVTSATGLARSRAAKQDAVFRLIELGVLTDPELIAEQLDMPLPSFVNHRAMDVRLARNENMLLDKGDAVTPNSFDDHTLHLREHNARRKTAEFWMLPEEVRSRYDVHCQMHEAMLDQQLAKQAERAMLAQGMMPAAPGGGAAAAPPAEEVPV